MLEITMVAYTIKEIPECADKVMRSTMAFETSLLDSLFRLLTPNEINELTTTSGDNKKIPLSLIGDGFVNGKDYQQVLRESSDEPESTEHEAKILPFGSDSDSDENDHEASSELESLTCAKEVESLLTYFVEQCKIWDSNVLGASRPGLNLNAIKKKETSTFIIDEKKKFEVSSSKLKSVEVLDLYRKNSKVDIELQKNNKEDLSKASQSGVLVNKKHA